MGVGFGFWASNVGVEWLRGVELEGELAMRDVRLFASFGSVVAEVQRHE